MSKSSDVIIAGIIAGIVTYATHILGISGTVIGFVAAAILYQVMSHLSESPLKGIKTQNVGARLVYIFPLVLIVGIEILFILAKLYLKPGNFFYTLENATNYNLFTSIGVGLIIMGIYPLILSDNIKKVYGYIIAIVGIIVLLGGVADSGIPITDIYSFIFAESGIIISLMVIAALSYVIFAIAIESIKIINDKNKRNIKSYEKISEKTPKYGEKIDHWLDKQDNNVNDSKVNDDTKNDHDMR